ncbi:cytidine deaminase [Anaerolineae bacterium]|nr:cytidine deaminase [Anaerolineaceae bacterium]GBL37561.1 cytidine deaminase [Anaerolineaceae bacterium]GDX67739.1 cytidine deaminase [Anaerolineae bacterium]
MTAVAAAVPTADQQAELVQRAVAAMDWAYAPYSKFPVGAALLAASGRIYDGVNVENAAYPAGVCAERTAVFKAVSEGEREFVAVAVATRGAGAPCGVCRQVLAEFGYNMAVILADKDGSVRLVTTLAALLPEAFLPQHLV